MTDLVDLVESYKREVAPLGGFTAAFPGATNADVVGALSDGFAQAQLEGFFGTTVLDPDAGEVTPDISQAGGQLVIIFAGMRAVRAQMLTLRNTRYKAGPVEAETSYLATVLTELLKDLRVRRDALLERARVGARTPDLVYDGYAARVGAYGIGGSVGGYLEFFDGEMPRRF